MASEFYNAEEGKGDGKDLGGTSWKRIERDGSESGDINILKYDFNKQS